METTDADVMETEATYPYLQTPTMPLCCSHRLLNAFNPERTSGHYLRGFKLREVFADSSVYVGYSFGDHIYRECHHCEQGDENPNPILAFSVNNRGHTMTLRYHSTPLFVEVTKITGCIKIASDGLQLLKYQAALEDHLRFLKSEETSCNAATIKDLDLLVSGLLSDDEPFCSFGYEDLPDDGYISADRFKSVRQSRIDRDIDTINQGFLAIDEARDARKDRDRKFLPIVKHDLNEQVSEPTEQTRSSFTTIVDFEPFEDLIYVAMNDTNENLMIHDTSNSKPSLGNFDPFHIHEQPADEYVSLNEMTCIDGMVESFFEDVEPRPAQEALVAMLCWDYDRHWEACQSMLLFQHATTDSVGGSWDNPASIASVDDDNHRQQPQLTKLECLHHEFSIRIRHAELDVNPERMLWDDWRTMSSASSAFTDSWSADFERAKRKGWTAGMRVLRRLTRGKMPATLYETIMFLTVASAIAAVRDNFENMDMYHMARFKEDLSRWQLVFAADPASLRKFRLAVDDLWYVNLEYPLTGEGTSPDPDTLIHFQEMVLRLVREGAPFLSEQEDGGGESVKEGLLFDQERWRIQTQESTDPPTSQVDQTHLEHAFDKNKSGNPLGDIALPQFRPPVIFPATPCVSTSTKDSPTNFNNPMICLLMAGAIFAMFIAFLLEMAIDKPGSAKSTHGKPGTSNLQTPILKTALQHVLLLLNDNASDGWRLSVESAIAAGFISNFSSLVDWIKTNVAKNIADPLVSDEMASRLSWIYSTWRSSYALQESYRTLEVYLGLETFKSIVPHILLPRAYPLDDPSQGSAVLNTNSTSQNIPDTSDHPPYFTPTANSATTSGSLSLSTPRSFSTSTSTTWSSSPPINSFPEPAQQARTTFCVECNHDFKKVCNYNKHRRDRHEIVKYECRVEDCKKKFSRNQYRKTHEGKEH